MENDDEDEEDALKAMMMEAKKEEGVDLTEPQEFVKPGSERFSKLPVTD